MDPAPERCGKGIRKALSTGAGVQLACDEENWDRTGKSAFLPAPGAAESEIGLTGPSLMSAQTRLAYGLLKAAMDEAVQTIESNRSRLAAKWWGLHANAIESVYVSALATIELMEAINRAEGPKEVAAAQIAHRRRQREAANRQIIEFLAAARNMISVLTALPSDPLVDCSKAGECPTAPCKAQSVAERLKTLTERQMRVLALIAEGLPNKVIAYELGLCETTVKAHVSEILRKLCVYNRARAIVLLANIDLASIGSSGLDANSGGR